MWKWLAASNIGTATAATLVTLFAVRGCENAVQKDNGPVAVRSKENLVAPTKAETLLRTLPEKIHDATVEKHDVPGAVIVIVQVNDVHNIGSAGRFPLLEHRVAGVQRENGPVIEFLTAHFGTKVVFPEGFTTENELLVQEEINGAKRELQAKRRASEARAEMVQHLQDVETRLGKNSPEAKRIRDGLAIVDDTLRKADAIREKNLAQLRHAIGAITDPVIEGRIHVAISESGETNPMHMAVPNKSLQQLRSDPVWKKKLWDDRERDILLHVRAGGDGAGRILILGADHDLWPWIQQWNAANPQQKIAYVRVTAAATREMQKRLELEEQRLEKMEK